MGSRSKRKHIKKEVLEAKDHDKKITRENMYIFLALASLSLNSQFGFGKDRMKKFVTRFINQLSCVRSNLLSGPDLIEWCKEHEILEHISDEMTRGDENLN